MNFASSNSLILVLMMVATAGLLFIVARPNAALASTFLLVHFATTKFRNRSAQALLSGEIDAQIFFELALYATVGVIVLRCLLRIPAAQRRFRFYELLIVAYLTIASVSVLWSPTIEISAVRVVQSWILLALVYVAIRILTPERTWDIFVLSTVVFVLMGFCIAAFFPSTTAGIPVRFGEMLSFRQTTRFTFLALHPGMVATLAAVSALLMGARVLFPTRRGDSRVFGLPPWVSLVPLVVILLATHSRGPTIGFLAGALVLVCRKLLFGPGAKRTFASLAFVTAWVACTLIVAFQQFQRLQQSDSTIAAYVYRGGDGDQLLTLNGRTKVFQAVGELAMNRPLLGYGFMASRSVLLDKIPWAGNAHNAIAESLLNVGLVGTILLWIPFLLMLGVTSISVFRAPVQEIHYRAGMLAGGVFLLFNSVVSPSFAGAPGFEVLSLFVLVGVHAHIPAKHRLPLVHASGRYPFAQRLAHNYSVGQS